VSGRAARLTAPGTLQIEPLRLAEPTREDAVVRITASGVCGTDVQIFHGVPAVEAGRVLGHEGAGVVEAVGDPAQVEPGTPVVVDPTIACGSCPVCREGLGHLCLRGGLLGRELDGVFADEAVVPIANVYPLPDGVPPADAPLLQVLATVVHAQQQVEVTPSRVAAVVGLGCTGQLHAQLLANRGARVLGVSRSAGKRELGARLGCEWTAHPDDAGALVAEHAPLGGADLVIECAGTLPALDEAISLVRPGGTILAYGIQTEVEGRLAFYQLYKKEVRLVGARASLPRDMALAIDLAARGAVELTPLVSDRLRLDRAAEAITRSEAGSLKVLMEH
jgi:2-desacetyl-2-hydroxyethyl bacteriochlorophyllide A dehydrogenase